MNRARKIFAFYAGTILMAAMALWFLLSNGRQLESGKFTGTHAIGNLGGVWSGLLANIRGPLATLILQIIVILLAIRIVGVIFRKIRQPAVIGEIVAGIVLGPSVVGYFFPAFSNHVFPFSSMANLQALSQIGLILFMFIVGMELDLTALKHRANTAIVISHVSILLPFVLGVGFALVIYREYAPEAAPFIPFALFMGIAMSITAFPVLARIVRDRNLNGTPIGNLVITCAAFGDVTAWCILAIVVGVTKGSSVTGGALTALFAVLYAGAMLLLVRPLLQRYTEHHVSHDRQLGFLFPLVFLTLLSSALATEAVGIHALFGAFIAGVCMPQNETLRKLLQHRIEDVVLILLLPLFFAFSGLRTQVGMLNTPQLWLICLAAIAVAVTGKFVGSLFAARLVGQSWRDSVAIGALMNTRGLVELVALNIGYDLGILSPVLFTMMVIMALVTTFMAGPVLSLVQRRPEEEVSPHQLVTSQEPG